MQELPNSLRTEVRPSHLFAVHIKGIPLSCSLSDAAGWQLVL